MKVLIINFFIFISLGVFSQTPNKALELNNTLDVIGFNYPSEFTLEFMVNTNALDTAILPNFYIAANGGFTLSFSGQNCIVNDPVFLINKWYRVSIVKDASLSIYINGVKTVSSLNVPVTTTDNLQFLNGKIDDIRVWDVALDATTIQYNMFKHLLGTELNLILYLDLDTNTDDITSNFLTNSVGNTLIITTSFSNYSGGLWYGTVTAENCMFLGDNDLDFNLSVNNFVTEETYTTTVKDNYTITLENYYFGNLKIEENAGLIQENTVVNFQPIITSSTGKISEFRYDYWSSAGYKNIVLDYGTPTINENQNVIIPTSTKTLAAIQDLFTIGNNVGEHESRWTYAMHGGIPYGEAFNNGWSSNPTNRGLISGMGFTLKGAVGSLATNALKTFNTVPENGNVAIDFSHIPNDDVLIGNPYPSLISLKEFINQNQVGMQGYIEHWLQWDGNSHNSSSFVGGYAVQNILGTALPNAEFLYSGNSLMPNENIVPRKSFLIWTTTAINNIVYNNSMRIPSNTIVDNSDKNRFWISLKKDGGNLKQTDQLLIGATSTTTNAFDYGYDASYYHDHRATLIYSFLPGDATVRYKVQSVTNTFIDDVNIGVKIGTTGNYTIKMQAEENMGGADDILLVDTLTGIDYNLRTSDAVINFDSTGVFDNRFLIRFKDPLLSVEENTLNKNIIVWQDDTYIHIENKNIFKSIQLINLSGQIIYQTTLALISKENLASGMYIIKAVDFRNNILTKKVILE